MWGPLPALLRRWRVGNHVSSGPVRLIVGMIVGALFAALVGFLIGIPVLRLKGDYLAIVTLAFGEIIKGIFNNLFVGIDSSGLHVEPRSATRPNLAEDGQLVIGGPMGLQPIPRLSNFVIGVILVLITLIIVFQSGQQPVWPGHYGGAGQPDCGGERWNQCDQVQADGLCTVSAALAGAAGTLFAMNYTTIAGQQV